MKNHKGFITEKDLAQYKAIERNPLKGTYREFDIITVPPPSSGGATLIQLMNIMEQADFDTLEFNSAPYVHFLAESMRRAYADRARYLGDPDFNPDIPVDKLISKEYARIQFQSIDMKKATVSDTSRFGNISEGDNTTHLSVIDKDGNAVSLTYTLEYSYGSGLVAEELGFIFNNEMGDFNPVPGITTNSGQIGTKPNLIEPGKRMLSSMTPTIVAKNGKPYLIIGSPGGRTIINTVFQTILCVVEFNMNVKRAIEAMKIHHQWLPDQITYEQNLLSPDTRKTLEKMGHKLTGTSNLGSLMGILNDHKNNIYVGAFDSSAGEGGAAGY
jgi:gamma-glutamyltranspeptidase/glutathione hydrolase